MNTPLAIIIISLAVHVVSFYVIFNLNRKYSITANLYEDLLGWYSVFKHRIDAGMEKLEYVDKRGGFESDDEIGFLFKDVKEMQQELKTLVDVVDIEDELKGFWKEDGQKESE